MHTEGYRGERERVSLNLFSEVVSYLLENDETT